MLLRVLACSDMLFGILLRLACNYKNSRPFFKGCRVKHTCLHGPASAHYKHKMSLGVDGSIFKDSRPREVKLSAQLDFSVCMAASRTGCMILTALHCVLVDFWHCAGLELPTNARICNVACQCFTFLLLCTARRSMNITSTSSINDKVKERTYSFMKYVLLDLRVVS